MGDVPWLGEPDPSAAARSAQSPVQGPVKKTRAPKPPSGAAAPGRAAAPRRKGGAQSLKDRIAAQMASVVAGDQTGATKKAINEFLTGGPRPLLRR